MIYMCELSNLLTHRNLLMALIQEKRIEWEQLPADSIERIALMAEITEIRTDIIQIGKQIVTKLIAQIPAPKL